VKRKGEEENETRKEGMKECKEFETQRKRKRRNRLKERKRK
jgi:hypothetical protein